MDKKLLGSLPVGFFGIPQCLEINPQDFTKLRQKLRRPRWKRPVLIPLGYR